MQVGEVAMWDWRFAAAAGAARVEAIVVAVDLVEEVTPTVVTVAGGEEAVEFVDAQAAAEGTGVWIPPCT